MGECLRRLMMSERKERLYIITLKFDLMSKRMSFIGEDSEYGNVQFRLAIKKLNEVGDTAKDWNDFLDKAITHFKEYEFYAIKR